MNKAINVAIDGPAGAGKSTVAKLVSERLSLLYIDTGAMYRTLTYAALKEHVDLENGQDLRQLLDRVSIKLVQEEQGTRVFLNNEDVTLAIRTAEVNHHVSQVARHEQVRKEMVMQQRQLARNGGAVLDGRDIGTCVLPDAEIKVFLTASVEERAKRRHQEQLSKGLPSNLEELKKEISRRDKLDSTREIAPLTKADDAIEIDSTSLSISEVAAIIVDLVKERVT
ncbi:(d)CMP kinase [Halalkalibacter urbisdiaboli]|uniref:(d)CMP kinase n=1 Tax=Halalkalibacter urbisdiaboli TaxID=1960589 RepID=UPI000B454ED0|nr:(d)CMP kinase [Halalkalibacter urbisdiaboli]